RHAIAGRQRRSAAPERARPGGACVLAAIILASVAAVTYGRGNRTDMAVTLKFTPQEGVTSTTVVLSSALLRQPIAIRVQDARQLSDPLVIGHATGGNDKVFPSMPTAM